MGEIQGVTGGLPRRVARDQDDFFANLAQHEGEGDGRPGPPGRRCATRGMMRNLCRPMSGKLAEAEDSSRRGRRCRSGACHRQRTHGPVSDFAKAYVSFGDVSGGPLTMELRTTSPIECMKSLRARFPSDKRAEALRNLRARHPAVMNGIGSSPLASAAGT